jgi:MoxR-like ATPase
MMTSNELQQPTYEGKGNKKWKDKSLYRDTLPDYESPQYYYASDELADAVNTAIFLRQPLLITGAPGAGKTQLAHSIAWELGIPLHIFNTKMNSSGPDLFYRYDSLLQFHDSHQSGVAPNPRRYVSYAALGRAILQSWPRGRYGEYFEERTLPADAASAELSTTVEIDQAPQHAEATQSVVLIDEIDKAPRDFPNDILYETERLRSILRKQIGRLSR